MRARYYSPELRRFINADIIAGEITNAITLNRYAYANGNPVSNIDPFGLSADDKTNSHYVDIGRVVNQCDQCFKTPDKTMQNNNQEQTI